MNTFYIFVQFIGALKLPQRKQILKARLHDAINFIKFATHTFCTKLILLARAFTPWNYFHKFVRFSFCTKFSEHVRRIVATTLKLLANMDVEEEVALGAIVIATVVKVNENQNEILGQTWFFASQSLYKGFLTFHKLFFSSSIIKLRFQLVFLLSQPPCFIWGFTFL